MRLLESSPVMSELLAEHVKARESPHRRARLTARALTSMTPAF